MTPPFSSVQSRVHERLQRLVGTGAAAFFADACALLQNSADLRTTTHVHGHLTREVESSMRQTLVAIPEVRDLLPKSNPKKGGDATHRNQVVAVLSFLGLGEDARACAWLTFVGSENARGLYKAAHRDDLRGPRKMDDAYRERSSEFLHVLDAVLDAVETKYAVTMATLDRVKAATPPSETDISFVVKHVGPGTITERFFFLGLSAAWLEPLREQGYFRDPGDDPHWPAAAYLATTAASAPSCVADIIEAVAPTSSQFIHCEFLNAAIAMLPSDLESAVRVALQESQWLAQQVKLDYLIPDRVRDLAVKLVAAGRDDVGAALVGAVLAFPPMQENDWGPRTKLSSWEYAEVVKKFFGALAAVDLVRCASLVTPLLRDGCKSGRWHRAAIEDHMQNGANDDALDELLVMLRDVSVRRADRSLEDLKAVVEELESIGDSLFRRIALHVLSSSSTCATEMIAARLTDQELMDDFHVFHEFSVLAQRRFGTLPQTDRGAVVAAFRQHAANQAANHGDADESATLSVERLRRRYMRQWLSIIESELAGDLLSELRGIVEEFGPVGEQPTFHAYVSSHCGNDPPPRVAAELAALSDAELRRFLLTWNPPRRTFFLEPTRSSLANEVQRCAKDNLERFLRTDMLEGLHPRYVAAILQSAVEASRGGQSFGPSAADSLTVVEWVISQGRTNVADSDLDADDEDGTPDDDWTWAHRLALDLTSNVVERADPGDDLLLRRAWAIMQRMRHHPDPSPETAARRGDEMASFNCVRGAVVHAMIAFGLRARRGGNASLATEIHEAIVATTDPANEPVSAVRQACLFDFLCLHAISAGAARAVAERLFPRRGADDAERQAAWSMFLQRNRSTTDTFDFLSEAYQLSVDNVGSMELEDAKRLGVHLVWLAVYGSLPLSTDGLLARFVQSAPVEAREHAIEQVGRALHRECDVDAGIVATAKAVWTWWREAATRSGEARDLAAFGWWFRGSLLGDEWLLGELGAALDASGGAVASEHTVAERLAELVPGHAREVATVADKFLDGGDGWRVMRAQKGVRSIVEGLLQTPEAPRARAIASRLVARGHGQFRDLTIA